MKVRPLGDRILVSVLRRERVTGGGVVLPDNVREESDRGVVLAKGPGARRDGDVEEIPVDEGQVVLFSPYAGSKVSVGSADFLLLRQGDILGVLEGAMIEETQEGAFQMTEAAPVH